MSSPRAEFSRRAVRWLWPAALLALTPKCLLCLLAYAGVGAALGLSGPELCGTTPGAPSTWTSSLAWLGLASGCITVGFVARRRYTITPSLKKPSPRLEYREHVSSPSASISEPLKPDIFDWP